LSYSALFKHFEQLISRGIHPKNAQLKSYSA
jgi:hypothetical protein